MTPEQIADDYLAREGEMKAKRRGDFDTNAIIAAMMNEHGLTREEIRRAVIDHTIMQPN